MELRLVSQAIISTEKNMTNEMIHFIEVANHSYGCRRGCRSQPISIQTALSYSFLRADFISSDSDCCVYITGSYRPKVEQTKTIVAMYTKKINMSVQFAFHSNG